MSDRMKKILLSIFIGLSCGVFMSILLLYMMISTSFTTASFGFVLCVAAAAAMPLCLSFVKGKRIMLVWLSQIVMVITSFLICLLYGQAAMQGSSLSARFTNIFDAVLKCALYLHACSLVGIAATELVDRMRKR